MDIKRLGSRSAALDTLRQKQNQADKAKQTAEQQGGSRSQDTVSLSSQSKTLSQAAKVLDQDATARRDRVAALKEQVENGTYSVDSKDVAGSIVSFFSEESGRA